MSLRHVDSLNDSQLDDLVGLFRTTWWAADRDRAVVTELVHGSDVVCGFADVESGRLHAFCRVLTDATTIALVLDVIVAPALRGSGVGKDMLEHLLRTPPICDVGSVELVCQPEVVPFYERVGFTTNVGRSLLMRRTASPTLAADPAITNPTTTDRLPHSGQGR